jgi:hypothetical protein
MQKRKPHRSDRAQMIAGARLICNAGDYVALATPETAYDLPLVRIASRQGNRLVVFRCLPADAEPWAREIVARLFDGRLTVYQVIEMEYHGMFGVSFGEMVH